MVTINVAIIQALDVTAATTVKTQLLSLDRNAEVPQRHACQNCAAETLAVMVRCAAGITAATVQCAVTGIVVPVQPALDLIMHAMVKNIVSCAQAHVSKQCSNEKFIL